MKRTLLMVVLLWGSLGAGMWNPASAQRNQPHPNPLKKGPNLALNITSPKQPVRTTYLNVGLMTNIYQLKGIGINALSSIVQSDMKGLQVTGLANITGRNASGFQLGGIANAAGWNAQGLQIGGLMNVAGNRSQGWQIAGLGNVTGKTSSGLTLGGLMNLAGREAQGLQIAGLANIAGDYQNGVAVAGLMNVAGEKTNGAQVSALLNISGGQTRGAQVAALGNVGIKVNGFQLSALANLCMGSLKGLQLAPGNYAGEVKGMQVGLANFCGGRVKGLQLGLVNHSKDSTAHQVGLVNLRPNTRVQMLVYGGNQTKLNVGVRFKNRHTYSLIGLGTHYFDLNDSFSGGISYRTGLYYALTPRLEISGDLGYVHLENFDNEDEQTPARMYALQVRINLEYQVSSRFRLFLTGGYGATRYYNQDRCYEKKPLVEAGIVLF